METATVIECTIHDDTATHLIALKERAYSALLKLSDAEKREVLASYAEKYNVTL